MSNNSMNFIFTKSNDVSFVISSCSVNDFLLEGVIYSPNYDLLLYFIDSAFLENELIFSIKIEVSIQNPRKKRYVYNLNCTFSSKKYFNRFSGIFDEIEQEKLSVKVSFIIKNASNLEINKPPQNYYSKQFNIVPLDSIKGERIYYDHEKCKVTNKKEIDDFFKKYDPREYKYFISFHGTEEIIGPIRHEKLNESLISQYPTFLFPISEKIHIKSKNLIFFVEMNDKNSEFFGIFPLSDIQNVLSKEYSNFTVNCQRFNPDINYPSGTVVCGYRKTG